MSNNPPYYGFKLPEAENIPPNPQRYPSVPVTSEHGRPTAPTPYFHAPSAHYLTNAIPPSHLNNAVPYGNAFAGFPAFGAGPNGGVPEMHVQQHYNFDHQPAHLQNTAGPLWVKWHKGQLVPNNAVQGGTDVDNAKIFVGRLYHKGDLLPAKVIPEKNVAYVSHDGREFDYYECEVLCQTNVRWLASANGQVPVGAIKVGHTSLMEPLYVGRVHHKGSLTIGKIHPTHQVCYIPFGGKEKSHRNYEVLVG